MTAKRSESGLAGQAVARPALMIWALVTGAVLALFAVMAGAFGAHGLEVFEMAATYQMYHALGLVQTKGIGLITPIGGLCFMIGWLLLVVAALTFNADSKRIE